jgi:hypothetical protein
MSTEKCIFRYHLTREIWLFAVLTPMATNFVPRDVTPCSLIDRYQCCDVKFCFQLQTILMKKGATPFQMLIVINLPCIIRNEILDYTVCYRLTKLHNRSTRFIGSLVNEVSRL